MDVYNGLIWQDLFGFVLFFQRAHQISLQGSEKCTHVQRVFFHQLPEWGEFDQRLVELERAQEEKDKGRRKSERDKGKKAKMERGCGGEAK